MDEPQQDGPLVSCTAVTLDLDGLELHRGVTMFWMAGFIILATVSAVVLSGWVYVEYAPCCCAVEFLITAWFGWMSLHRLTRPTRRGRLRLFRDELVFQLMIFPGDPERLPLREIERLGRNRHKIHIRMREHNKFYFFACSRLHAEDMYDQITAQLDALGVEVATYESKRMR
jgi:hypothetical protein